MPKPGPGGNLPEDLWRKDQGLAAVTWLENRMKNGVRIEDAQLDERSEMPLDLAMVNIEAVHTRWVDNLSVFYQNADTEVFGLPGQKSTGNAAPSRLLASVIPA